MMNLTKIERADLPAAVYGGIRDLSQRKKLSGLAKEISEANQSVLEGQGLVPTSEFQMYIPIDELERAAMQVGVFSSGGAFVPTDLEPELDPVLRAQSVCERAGAVVMSDLSGNVQIPIEKTASSWSFYPEAAGTDITLSDGTLGALNLSPCRAAAGTSISGQANLQAPTLGRELLKSLNRGRAAAEDRACLVGSGVAGEPLGLFSRSTSGANAVSSITFGAAASFAKLCGPSSFESTLVSADVPVENLSWVLHPSIRAKFKSVQKFSGDADTLFDSDREYVGGVPAYVTSSVSSTLGLALGDWSRMVICRWGPGIRIVVNPYTLSMSDRIQFVCEMLIDVGITKPSCFCVAADSALQ